MTDRAEPGVTPLTAEELSLLDRLDRAAGRTRTAIERRITEIATDPDGIGRELPVNDDGRVWCLGCRRSVFPENWVNHLLVAGTHKAGIRVEIADLRRVDDGDPFNAGWNAALDAVAALDYDKEADATP